jgi:hypothetical protein
VSFLGHVIRRGGIAVDFSKVDAVLEWNTPNSVSEIRRFLGVGFTFDAVDSQWSSFCLGC